MNIRTCILIMAFGLSGCGGGDGGGSTSTPGGSQTPATSNGEPQLMTELNVPDGFSYNPVESVELDVDISAITTKRAFLSLYRNYDTVNDQAMKPDYSSRITAISLINGSAEINLEIADSQESVLGEIWFYDGSAPIQKLFYTDQKNWEW